MRAARSASTMTMICHVVKGEPAVGVGVGVDDEALGVDVGVGVDDEVLEVGVGVGLVCGISGENFR